MVASDEDEACIQSSILMKRAIATSDLAVPPKTGHLVNLEDPALFNRLLEDFLLALDTGRWPRRDTHSLNDSAR